MKDSTEEAYCDTCTWCSDPEPKPDHEKYCSAMCRMEHSFAKRYPNMHIDACMDKKTGLLKDVLPTSYKPTVPYTVASWEAVRACHR